MKFCEEMVSNEDMEFCERDWDMGKTSEVCEEG